MQELVAQLLGYARGVWHRRWVGLGVAWLVTVVGIAFIFQLPDKYQASARVYVDTQSLLRPLMSGMAINTDPGYQISILSRILFSRPNLEKIIRKADLDTSTGKSAAALVDETSASLRIARAPGDNLYTVSFQYPEPRKARDVVQAALSTFIEQSLGENRSGTESARRFLDAQIKEYEDKLRQAEAKVQAFRLKYMALLGTSGRDYLAQMGATEEQVKETRVELKVAEETLANLKQQLQEQSRPRPGNAVAASIPSAVPEYDGRIDTLRRQLDEMLRKYTERHPDVIAARKLLTELEEERNRVLDARRQAAAAAAAAAPAGAGDMTGDPVLQQLKVAVNEAESNVVALRARLSQYEARIGQLRAAAEMVPKVDTEHSQLNRDYGILKRQYESLVARRETADLTGKLEDAGVAEFRIIDPPRVTPKPVAPNRVLLLLGVLGGALGAGLAVSFLVSQLWPTFHDGRALREIVNRPLLGMVGMVPNTSWRRGRLRSAALFAAGMGGFFILNASALVMTYLHTRGQV